MREVQLVFNSKNLIYRMLLYIVLIPFLMPIGWEVYSSSYKSIVNIFTIVGILIGIILIFVNKKLSLKIAVFMIIVCCFELLIVTIYNQGGLDDGVKKIFITPILCLILSNLLKYSRKEVENVIVNILIVILLLNITVFSQYTFPQYFSVNEHMTFIGHVQSISMISILGILLGHLKFVSSTKKYKGVFLIALALANMIYSGTDASYLSLIVLLMLVIIGKGTHLRKIINVNMYKIGVVYFFANIFVLTVMPTNTIGNFVQRMSSGRWFVWNIGMTSVKEKLLFGYGAYGVKIAPFWTKWSTSIQDRQGFNYAHNTILQLLLDGGVVLLVLSILSVWLCIKNISKIQSENLQYTFNAIIIIWLLIATVESVVEYYFIFITLMIILHYSIEESNYTVIKK